MENPDYAKDWPNMNTPDVMARHRLANGGRGATAEQTELGKFSAAIQDANPPLTMSDVRDVRLTTTRELLAELRTRAENWRGVEPRSRWLGAVANDVEVALGDPMLDGTREP